MAGSKRSKPGGPSKYSPEVHQRIVSFVRSGSYVETAFAAAGIGKSAMHDWLRAGANRKSPYDKLLADIEEAQAKAELHDLALIARAAQTDWRAAAWRLEKRHQTRYGGKRRDEEAETAAASAPVINIHYPANGREGGSE